MVGVGWSMALALPHCIFLSLAAGGVTDNFSLSIAFSRSSAKRKASKIQLRGWQKRSVNPAGAASCSFSPTVYSGEFNFVI